MEVMDMERFEKRMEKNKSYQRAKRNQLVAEELFKVLQDNQLSLLDTEDVFARLKGIIKNQIHV